MSKEMAIIALGALVVLTRTLLGLPGNWQTIILVASGAAIMIIGFLLRGEALSRHMEPTKRPREAAQYSFAESAPSNETDTTHEHKEGITSLN